MTSSKNPLIFLIALCYLLPSCKDDSQPPFTLPDPSYDDAYNYFPSQNDYEWHYSETIKNGNDSILSQEDVKGVYSISSKSIVYTMDNQPRGHAVWYNSGSRLLCCEGTKLLDYTKLNCNQDSVLIEEETTANNTFIQIYQNCNKTNLLLEGYENIESIKTLQTNINNDGSKLKIERHFGYGIGLLYEKQQSINLDGSLHEVSTKTLTSHRF